MYFPSWIRFPSPCTSSSSARTSSSSSLSSLSSLDGFMHALPLSTPPPSTRVPCAIDEGVNDVPATSLTPPSSVTFTTPDRQRPSGLRHHQDQDRGQVHAEHPCQATAPAPTSVTRTPPHRTRLVIAHPYARLYAKRDASKRRKIWNHALEKLLFTPDELASMGAPHRRTIYTASLEAHVDRLHSQLSDLGLPLVTPERLETFRGLNSKTAKSIVAGLQYDASLSKLKLLELDRSNQYLHGLLGDKPPTTRLLAS